MVGPETKTRLERNPEPLSNFLDRKLRFYANVCCEIEVEAMWVVLGSKAVD